MHQQLSQLKIAFERIDALDGMKIAAKTLRKYQQQSKKSYLHYATLSAGEIGCALSWHKAWALVAKHNSKACVVLEDDVKLHDNFKNTIEKLSKSLDDNIIIDLSGKKGFLIKATKTINGIKLIRYHTPPLNNQGQIYGKKACQIFLNKIQNFKAPVDTLQQMLWLHDIKTWSLATGCLSHQDSEIGGSTISVKKKKLSTKLKKELLRPFWRGFIVIRNLLNYYK